MWDDTCTETTVYERGSSFGNVSEVGYKTAPPKEARKEVSMYPFGPLWVQPTIWLFILWLENAYYLSIRIPAKVRTTRSLTYPCRLHTGVLNSGTHRSNNGCELLRAYRNILWLRWTKRRRQLFFTCLCWKLGITALPLDRMQQAGSSLFESRSVAPI